MKKGTRQQLPDSVQGTLVQVARLYYEEALSQKEIADRLGVSRSLIAQYLQQAREAGIVHIRIVEPHSACSGLGAALTEATGIKALTVVSTPHRAPELALRAVASAAAEYISAELTDGDSLGLGWGRTTGVVADFLKPPHSSGITILPLMGESGHSGMHSQMNQLIVRAAEQLNAIPRFLSLPMVLSNPELRDALIRETGICDVIELWDTLSRGCVGIGVTPPVPGMIVYIGEEYLPKMIDAGAVGDICGIYFNREGEIIESGLEKRMIAANVEQLRATRDLTAVACGADKSVAVLGALRTGLINSLFIDQSLAEKMLAAVKEGR